MASDTFAVSEEQVDTVLHIVGDLSRDAEGRVIIDGKTAELLRSGVPIIDEYGRSWPR